MTARKTSFTLRFFAFAFAACALLAGCGRDAVFPSQPITLICPWSAGGGSDRIARQVASSLEAEAGVPVNVINATGGSGVTGHTRGALARADGYTLTLLTVELNMLHWRGLTTITHEDYAPLLLLNRDSAALFVRADSSLTTLDDLEQALKTQPGGLRVSGTALGGIWHIALAGWLNARGLDATAANWISINGSGQSLQELVAGGVDFVCCSLPEADAMLAGGQVRCLGLMAEERLPGYEQVPTFREQGHDWSLAGWRGVAAPKGTPPERLQILTEALQRAVAGEAFTQFMVQSGFNVSVEPPAMFADTLASQDVLFGDILSSEAFRQVSAEHFGAMIFPSVIGGLLALAAALAFARRSGIAKARASRPAVLMAVAVLAAAVLFLLTLEWLGFVLAAAALLAGLFLLFRVKWRAALPVACLVSVLVYQLFGVLLRVPLPRGLLGW